MLARSRPALAVGAAAVAVVLLAGCGGSSARTTDAPVISVATGLWPLAEAAEVIGQANVHVVDVVPAGVDPSGYHLTSAQAAQVKSADVVVDVAGSFQTSFDAAAAGARHQVTVEPVGSNPYVWLNPHTMEAVASQIATTLEAADPKARSTMQNGLENFQAQLDALDDDYQSTLSACPDVKLVTVNDAFGILHPRYQVTDTPIAPAGSTGLPTKATTAYEVKVIRSTGAKEIYNESWIPQSDFFTATALTGVKVQTLDTLAGAPQGGWKLDSDGKKYVSLMETNLGTISSALRCPNPDTD